MINKTSQTNRDSWLSRVWAAIVRPHPSVKEVGEYHRARLLAGISFALVLTVLFAMVVNLSTLTLETRAQVIPLILSIAAVGLLVYILSRTRYFMVGIIILVVGLSSFGYMFAIQGTSDPAAAVLTFMPIAFLLGVALLGTRGNVIISIGNLIFPLLMPFFFPKTFGSYTPVFNIVTVALFIGVMAVITSITRDRIERDRMAESLKVNRELQTLSVGLEQRIADRTRDLSLAAELGRRISLVRDLETLLNDTVTLIQEHFGLYYTQIYLLDQNTRSLVLSAGSGEIGKEMLRRSHRLTVDNTSINGTAVTDRRVVVVSDTSASMTFRPHELLPDTRSEMAIPLIAGERVLGVLDLQSSQASALTTDNQAVFETMAHQLAIALVNVDLFSQVQHSLAELETHSRRGVRQGWHDYLDGIETRERFGYAYDQMGVVPLDEPLRVSADDCAITAQMAISGEPVGKIQLVSDRPWSDDDRETAESVANLVAQQIENLRLLDQAERYRRDAEFAVRRLSRQEWGEFVGSSQSEDVAFVYTGDEVKSLATGSNGHAGGLSFEIKVQDEAIGEFGLNGVEHLSAEDEEVLQAVTSQLGAHLENLRLYSTSQQELAERQRAEKLVQEELLERMRTEDALRASQADLSNALRTAHMGYWELDLGTMLFTFNDDFYAMLRTTAEAEGGYQLTPEQYGKFVHPDDVYLMADETRKAIETTDPNYTAQVEHRVFFGDGEPGYISVLITVLKDESGKTIKTRGVNQDITERRYAEDALRASQADLSNALRTAHMGYWELDLATMVFTFNDDFYTMLHTTAEAEGGYQLTPQQYGKFVDPDDMHLMVEGTRRAIETTDPNFTDSIEHRFFYADGRVGYMSVLVTIVKDENGKTIKTRGVNQDITERVKASLAMDEQRRTLQIILNNMPVAVLAKDTKTFEFVMWNQAAEELFGMKSQDVIGKTDYDFYPKEQADAFRAADIEVVQDRKTVNIPEEKANNAKGETRILQTVKVPLVDEDDQPVLLLVVTADITEVKQAQETIAKRAEELEKVALVSTKVSTIQTPDEMLQTVVDLTKESFDLYHSHIYLIDETGDTLVLTKGAGEIGRQMVGEGRQILVSAEKSLVARAARGRHGVTVNDVRQDPDFLPHPLLPETRSEMAVPMVAGDRLLGVIDVQHEDAGRFGQEDVSILTTLAAQVAISLENARSYARAQRQAEREALINTISERIQATNSVENALQVAVREIGRALGAQHTAIRLGLERKNTDQS